MFLIMEGTKNMEMAEYTVETPLEEFVGKKQKESIVVVPILRAGLGMLEAAVSLIPKVCVGYIGLQRDEETSIASSYYCKLPEIKNRKVIIMDPMLATGGSAVMAIREIEKEEPKEITLLCIVASPEGISKVEGTFPKVKIIAGAIDRELNEKKYILPGLGDFGDRLYGTGC